MQRAKSVDVARIATNASGITVSTLKEAEHFARAGYRDILCAAGTVPSKFAHAARIRESGADLILVTDSPADAVAHIQQCTIGHFGLRYVERKPAKILFERGA